MKPNDQFTIRDNTFAGEPGPMHIAPPLLTEQEMAAQRDAAERLLEAARDQYQGAMRQFEETTDPANDLTAINKELAAGSTISIRMAPHGAWYIADVHTGDIIGGSTGTTPLQAMANAVRAHGATR